MSETAIIRSSYRPAVQKELNPMILQAFRQLLEQIDSDVSSVQGSERWQDREEVLALHLGNARYIILRTESSPPGPARATLSPREREIADLVARGLPNKSIAQLLDISPWTVAEHLRRLFAKLEVSSRAEMVAQIMQGGLISEAMPAETREGAK